MQECTCSLFVMTSAKRNAYGGAACNCTVFDSYVQEVQEREELFYEKKCFHHDYMIEKLLRCPGKAFL